MWSGRKRQLAGPLDLATLDTLREWVEALQGSTPDELRSGVLEVLERRAAPTAAGEEVTAPGGSIRGLAQSISSEEAASAATDEVTPEEPGRPGPAHQLEI